MNVKSELKLQSKFKATSKTHIDSRIIKTKCNYQTV